MSKTENKKLSPRELLFIDAYAANQFDNIKQSMIKAGYSERNAYGNCSAFVLKPHIAAAIEKRRAMVSARWSKDDKLKKLEDIGQSESYETKDRLKAIEIHNKMLGHNEQQTNTTNVNVGVSTVLLLPDNKR